MTTGRTRLGPDEKLLPTYKMRADQQLVVIKAACSAEVPVNAVRLAEATGFSAKNCGLIPIFAMNTGLLMPGHGRATYLPNQKGRAVARAWKKSEEEGLQALRERWRGQWFGRTVRERLSHGPVSREGLAAKLLLMARAEERRLKQVHVLLDLLIAVGMLVPQDDGYLGWFEGARHTEGEPYLPESEPTIGGGAAPQDEPLDSPTDETPSAPRRDPPTTADHEADGTRPADSARLRSNVPPPRSGSARSAKLGSQDKTFDDNDLLSLFLPPVLLADLTRLSADEVLALHGHLRAIAELTAKLRGRQTT
ncbi:hypothetical protein ACWGI8_01210 [Streptomyces sp. NPDC054841]